MLSCREATEVCSAEMERPLGLGERFSLRTHLMVCAGCAHYRKQIRALRQVMQSYAEGRALSGESEPGVPD